MGRVKVKVVVEGMEVGKGSALPLVGISNNHLYLLHQHLPLHQLVLLLNAVPVGVQHQPARTRQSS
jgi:hypothetical protein